MYKDLDPQNQCQPCTIIVIFLLVVRLRMVDHLKASTTVLVYNPVAPKTIRSGLVNPFATFYRLVYSLIHESALRSKVAGKLRGF